MNSALIMAAPAIMLYTAIIMAVRWDLKYRRIPNIVVFPCTLIAILFHSFLPEGSGFFSDPVGGLGVTNSVLGWILGFGVLFPMYALRTIGAGDVKLMAMIGAFLGPNGILASIIFTLLVGGIMAISVSLIHGKTKQVLNNVYYMLLNGIINAAASGKPKIDKPTNTAGTLPYGAAIALGTLIHIVLNRVNA